jgi:hypothetical protein
MGIPSELKIKSFGAARFKGGGDIQKSPAGDMILSDPGDGQLLDLAGATRFDHALLEQLLDILDVSDIGQDDQGRIELQLEKDLKSGLELWWSVLNEQIEPANTDSYDGLRESLEDAVEENKRLEMLARRKAAANTAMARSIPAFVEEDENYEKIFAGRR